MSRQVLPSDVAMSSWIDGHRHMVGATTLLAPLAAAHGLIAPETTTDRGRALLSAIVGQQLSTKAAAVIRNRVDALLEPGPLHRSLALVADDDFRSAGLSRAKIASLRDLSRSLATDTLSLESFDDREDEEIVSALTTIRGIGRWTAQMFLIFSMGRQDVLATTDLGIQVAVARLRKRVDRATPRDVVAIANMDNWHPYASSACLHLWRSLGGPANLDDDSR